MYMKLKSIDLIKQKCHQKNENFDPKFLKIGFHRVLSTSIDHLHMHVFLLPFNSKFETKKKYNSFFFADFEEIIGKFKINP